MDKEALYDLIDRHLRNELTEEENRQVNDRMLTDTEFVSEVNLHKEIHFSVADKDLQHFTQVLKETDQRYFLDKSSGNTSRNNVLSLYFKIAASIALLAIVISSIFLSRTTGNETDLFKQYFTAYEAPVNFRSIESPYTDEDWKQALSLYSDAKYEESIPYLTKVIVNKPGNKLAVLLRGVSYLSLGNTTSARMDFNTLANNNLFSQQATWYLALSFLKEGNVEEAQTHLSRINSGAYYERAQELLKKMP